MSKEAHLFLENETARRLYQGVKELPIIDYHCHLSPKEIYEDQPFMDIGQMWLSGDHYKWRLMRAFGIDEKYITGTASYKEKFIQFGKVVGLAAGSPLYHWCKMELSQFFEIDTPLNEVTVKTIYEEANKVIKEKKLSPRKLIKKANVTYIGTTDDVIDSLEYHQKIKDDSSFKTVVAPSFRTDNLLLVQRDGYAYYIQKLSEITNLNITDIETLEQAIQMRLDFFCKMGCKFTDVGIPMFPTCKGTKQQADAVLRKALQKEPISSEEANQYLFYLFVFLAGEYQKRDLVMQMHLAVKRNANSFLYRTVGVDCGGDCVGDAISQEHLVTLLDAINENSTMPETILYTLNTAMYDTLSTVAESFHNIRMGAAWWFQDHKSGIEQQLKLYAQTSHLATFLGMLTDSRSFLSYARHDYFRRIVCSVVGDWIEKGEFSDDSNAEILLRRICYDNIKHLTGD